MGACISCQPVMGMEVDSSEFAVNDNTEEIVNFLNENAKENINLYAVETEQWEYLIANGYIYWDSDEGHLKIQDAYDDTEQESILDCSEQLEEWNLALDLHVLEWDGEAQVLYTPEITSDILENVTEVLLEKETDNVEVEKYITRGVAHNCNYAKWNIGTTCARNYNEIKNFYNSMLKAQKLNPEVNPWLSTASYWVGFVREGGAWDYKVQKNYQTFCCTFGGVSGQDRSAEWIGNYNYGYTGKFLFDLNTLHTGSYIVSGMDPKDKSTDWPAIDKGYSHAP